jgi:hypothetical protein
MANITIDSHAFLGKLSVIKNCLSMLTENPNKKELLEEAIKANQALIDIIKKEVLGGENPYC